MEKKWYASKAFWGSVCVAIGILGSYMQGHIPLSEMVMGIGGALGVFGIRDALN